MTKKEFEIQFDNYSHLLDYDETDNTFIVKPTLHGDYTGTLVERSNYKEIANANYNWIVKLSWSYSTNAIGIDYKNLNSDSIDEITEILQQLDKYPLLNENLYSELQMELVDEAISDFKKSNPEYFYSNNFDEIASEYLYICTPHAYFIDFCESDFVEQMEKKLAIVKYDITEKKALWEVIENYMEKNTVNQFYNEILTSLSYHDFNYFRDLINNRK